jgi:hypothetical protein
MNCLNAADPNGVSIVLTATIRVFPGSVKLCEETTRRQQYLSALRFYAQHTKVYFIENSGYPLDADVEFTGIPNVHLRSLPPAEWNEKGKGYLEFKSLDHWYDTEVSPPMRFVKITGRYVIENIDMLLSECRSVKNDVVLADQCRRGGLTFTSYFSVSWEGYKKYFQGIYAYADDNAEIWIEHVVYKVLKARKANCRIFLHEPRLTGISGSTGLSLGTSHWKFLAQRIMRGANRLISRRELYFRGRRKGSPNFEAS